MKSNLHNKNLFVSIRAELLEQEEFQIESKARTGPANEVSAHKKEK